jgi:predicted DNA-binding transcriptional regulator AlpA
MESPLAACVVDARLPELVAATGFLVSSRILRRVPLLRIPNPMVAPQMNSIECLVPLALRPREAAKALSISDRLLWQLTKDGFVPCVRVGSGKRKTVLYPTSELQAWLSREAANTEGGLR